MWTRTPGLLVAGPVRLISTSVAGSAAGAGISFGPGTPGSGSAPFAVITTSSTSVEFPPATIVPGGIQAGGPGLSLTSIVYAYP